jgi:hypothetical protein
MTVIDPNGRIALSKDSLFGQTEIFLTLGNTTTPVIRDIPGKYTFIIENLGNSPMDVRYNIW